MELGKQYLATTGISEMWDLSASGILFLGPWCLSGDKIKQLGKDRTYSTVQSPWKPSIKIKEAADFCHEIYEEILPELSEQLNLMHSVSYQDRYWRVLVGPWLFHFIEILYERYKRIENAFDLFPNAYTSILSESLCNLSSVDTYDFVFIRGKATQDYYNLKLFSSIMHYMYPGKAVDKKMSVPPVECRILPNSSVTKRLFYGVKKIKDVFLRPDIILSDMYHSDWAQMLSLEFESRSNSIVFKNFDVARTADLSAYSKDRRQGFKFKKESDKFHILLRRLISEAIPMCYVENFKKYRERVKREKVKAVGSAVGWYFNENFKFFAAESMLEGAKLVDFQHGGGYGISLSCPTETTSLEKDIFYTWGWRSRNSKKTIPLASPHLSELWNTHKLTENNILLMGNNIHRYLCRFMTIFTPDDIPQYFSDKIRFFHALNQATRQILLYRPYQEIGWRELAVLKNKITDLKISSKNKLTKLMQNTKIAVIDYLGTSNLEALVINVPTIWFWDPNIWLIRPEAEKYFDLLREVGILYNSPEEAARKVNEINDNPLGWWRDSKIQKARDLFCKEFAFTSTNWRKEWIDALNVYR